MGLGLPKELHFFNLTNNCHTVGNKKYYNHTTSHYLTRVPSIYSKYREVFPNVGKYYNDTNAHELVRLKSVIAITTPPDINSSAYSNPMSLIIINIACWF